jgi:[acyl-carrier-protein] S-malonyltransferase
MRQAAELQPRVGVLFPGQGSQFPGMVDPWLEHAAGREVVQRVSDIVGVDVAEACRDAEALSQTEMTQLGLFVSDLAAFGVLKAEGVSFHAAAGHSLGEYAALVATGAVGLEDGLQTVMARAQAMGEAGREQPGTMTAVIGLSPQDAREVCEMAGRGDVLAVANENAPKQIVLSGTIPAVERAEALARDRGAKAIRLQVAGAFHSPLMKPALQLIRDTISRVQFNTPEFPVVPNVSARPTTQPLALRDLLGRHLVSPVRWESSMRAMDEMGITWFVEAGPGDVLIKLARRAVPGATIRAVGSPETARTVAQELREAPVVSRAGEG